MRPPSNLRSNALFTSIFLLTVLAVAPLQAQGQANRRERILSFDSAVQVHADSTMDVTETIRVWAAGDKIRRGILRDFPTHYADRSGLDYVVGFAVKSVTRDGTPEPFTVSPWENGERVRIGRANASLPPGEHTYVITYTTDHQLGFFDDHDELYWNATGFWPWEIEQATAEIALPDGISAKAIKTTAYTGPEGSRGTAWKATVDKAGVAHFATTARLESNEGLTIVVGWPKGFVVKPPPRIEPAARPAARFPIDFKPGWWRIPIYGDAGGSAMLCAAALLFIVYMAAWFRVGRDPQSSIPVMYEPPRGLSPAAVRYVRKLTTDPKTFTAAVLSLATKGFLTVDYDHHTYKLKRTGKQPSTPLTSDEETVSAKLFDSSYSLGTDVKKFEIEMDALEKDHPLIAKVARGLAALATPADDENTTELRRSSPRVRTAFAQLAKSLASEHPAKRMIRTHIGLVALGALLTLIATAATLALYPERITGEFFMLVPFAVFAAVWNIIAGLTVAGRLSALLPVESFAPPRSIWRKILIAAGAVISLAVTAATAYAIAWVTSVEWAAAFSAMWIMVGVFQRLIKAPTKDGQQLWNETEGFRMFLSAVEQDRLDRMSPPAKTPALFERMLPYAVALECENAWAKQFENVLVAATAAQAQSGSVAYSPAWYSGPSHAFSDLHSFTSSIGSSFSSAIASSTTAPGSSSGGGGGGSSGGGGGGGGGGGW